MKFRPIIVLTAALACAVLAAAFFVWRFRVPERKEIIGWKEDFDLASGGGNRAIPKGWKIRKKPGTRPAVFTVIRDKKDGSSFLRMKADKASAALLSSPKEVDLRKTPVLRWRWRVTVLPEGGDGRIEAKDDQAIGIYVGAGSVLNRRSVSYRWDTETPKGAEGDCRYGDGTLKVKWYTLRNKEDTGNTRWFVEERNCAEDFKKAWGFCPKKIYLGVSCNSQYTGTKAEADLDWIEFVSGSDKL